MAHNPVTVRFRGTKNLSPVELFFMQANEGSPESHKVEIGINVPGVDNLYVVVTPEVAETFARRILDSITREGSV